MIGKVQIRHTAASQRILDAHNYNSSSYEKQTPPSRLRVFIITAVRSACASEFVPGGSLHLCTVTVLFCYRTVFEMFPIPKWNKFFLCHDDKKICFIIVYLYFSRPRQHMTLITVDIFSNAAVLTNFRTLCIIFRSAFYDGRLSDFCVLATV